MTSLLRLPLKLAGTAADAALNTARLLGSAAGLVTRRRRGAPAPESGAPRSPAARPAPPQARPVPPAPSPASPSARPAPPVAAPPNGVPADTPFEAPTPEPTRGEAGEHRLRERDAEVTEESPGAEIHVGEPWPGYGSMSAGDVIDRLAVADVAQRAVVLLYEQANRGRVTVLRAAREP